MKMISLLGVALGPSDALMSAKDGDNPKGFWEHQPISDLNGEILAALGGT